MLGPRKSAAAKLSDWAMRTAPKRWGIRTQEDVDPEGRGEHIGYSLGGPQSAEGRRMRRVSGRRTFYEDDGIWVIRGAELIKRLKNGPVAWNKFRWRNKRYRPILSSLRMPNGGSFRGYNFSNGKFVGSDFSNVDFENAVLRDIDAKVCVFHQCKFKGADLTRANFFDAQFIYCDFTDSKLTDAFLVRALFRHCTMNNAEFSKAEFGETDFVNVTLSGAQGLGNTKHEAPSNIDLATLGQVLPIGFLRGVGLSEELLSAQPLFGSDASSYCSCFISFSTKDQKFTEKLYADLQASGVRCWFAPHNLDIGAATFDEIYRQISRLDKLIIVLSKSSLRSQWVEDEVLKAYAEERRRNERVLLPLRLDDTVMRTQEPWALKLRDQRNIGDFKSWRSSGSYRKAFGHLLSSLRREREQAD